VPPQAVGVLITSELLNGAEAVQYDTTLVLAIKLSSKTWVLAAQVPGLPKTKAKRTIEPDKLALQSAIDGYRTRAAAAGNLRGEPRVCSMVPIPDESDEDARRCVRERTELVSERVGLANRIGAVLATLGIDGYNPLLKNRRRRLAGLRTGLDEPIPPHALAKIERLLSRLELVLDQIAALEKDRDAVVEMPASDDASRMIQQLCSLRGIGAQSATILVREAFVRRFAKAALRPPA
jgi:transposase